jgi:metal-responsive CopG/Arc/MetJ family transcriptional regulator
MRTTIEIQDHLRARLLELAARRGLKGFSILVEEAIERYLEEHDPRDERVEAALSVLGTMNEEDADAMEHSIQQLRGRWR